MAQNTWHRTMIVLVVSVVASVTVLAEQQEELPTGSAAETAPAERSSYGPNDYSKAIQQCQTYAQTLVAEKQRLRAELDAIKARIEAAALQDMEEDESNESHSRSRGIRRNVRGKRGASTCEGGTVAQWACGSQCIFKLKGLCGLSLRAMCHC